MASSTRVFHGLFAGKTEHPPIVGPPLAEVTDVVPPAAAAALLLEPVVPVDGDDATEPVEDATDPLEDATDPVEDAAEDRELDDDAAVRDPADDDALLVVR